MPPFRRREKQPYDQKFYEQLIKEGYSPEEATRIAATEMNGVATLDGNNPDGLQTYCNALEYPPDPEPLDPRTEKAKQRLRSEAEQAAKTAGFSDLKSYYKSLDLPTDDLD